MARYKIYVENGRVVVSPISSGVTVTRTSHSIYAQTLQLPANGYLTASVVNTNNIRVVTATGTVLFNDIPYDNLRTYTGVAINTSAAATVNTLNGSEYFDFSADFDSLTQSHTTELDAIADALLYSKGAGTGPLGIYYNDQKATDESYFAIDADEATVQAAKYTRAVFSETSGIGDVSIGVGAGTSGSEIFTEVFNIRGDNAGRTETNHKGHFNILSTTGQGQGALRFYESSTNGTNYIGFVSPSSLNGNKTYTLPSVDPTGGQVLSSTAGGSMSWVTKDNYQYFNLKTDGTQRKQIGSTNDLDLKGTAGKISLSYSAGGVVTFDTAALFNVVDDTSPQLGGDLDVQANVITTSTTNGNIVLDPNGTGAVVANGHLQLETQSAPPAAISGGLYADNSDNLYFGVS